MISGIHISTSEMILQKGDGKKSLPNFVKGKILKATVLDWSPKGTARLLINGREITARTSMLLETGQEVELKVVREKDAVVLKLVAPVQKMTTQRISSLVSFFSKNGSIPDITGSRLEQVKTALTEMALKSGKADREFLPRLIENSGMVWEKKVAAFFGGEKQQPDIKTVLEQFLRQDLKGSLLREAMTQGQEGTGGGRSTVGFLETLESFQLLNHNSSESGRFLLPFPVLSDGMFRFGQLLIDTGGKSDRDGREQDKMVRVSFLLNMTRLGLLRADFSILKKGISGRFLLQDEATCSYVASYLPELKETLLSKGYHAQQVECAVAQKEEIQESSLIESLVKAGDKRVLNIIV